MTHVVDWSSSAVEWTVNGYELSAPLAPHAGARQAQAVNDAVEAAFRHLRRDDVLVSLVEPDDDSAAELLLTSPDLLSIDPGLIRHTVDAAADDAANRAAGEAAADAPIIAGWLAALRGPS